MALRCGCANEADDIVFGKPHRCEVDPKPPADLPRFVPSSAFVVPGVLDPGESVHAGNIQAELDRLEPLYQRVLSDEAGDLG